ncbi:D-alanine-D-alanine ligase [Chitinophaga terrae (ex Kim and Jung 2007)]|uniref:D-alanine--D-alanine ligase n=1 Tax=Chitinophaga terrae (ex Kim and Jung 2007) TaxID=408074 RepID=UPI00278AD79F|nr:D-alanine--D-alanine ligase [Chitinophaga terrae (ex Kim and Jung 2007)]MDQ0110248.1 D-alanine-D-alanine ligase [Chitinophaga terrae (ex Kim and Jung 2007)]
MKKNIALVAGGYSGEYVISVQSAVTIEQNLDNEKYNVYKIIVTKDSWSYTGKDGVVTQVDKNDFSLTVNGEKIKFDAVFIGIHGTPGEDGRLQGYFEMLGIPFTSCGMVSSALTFNKSYCNKVVAALNVVKVSKSVHIFRDQPYNTGEILEKLRLPVFVKPAEGGSSIGMSKVKTAEELEPAIQKAFKEDSQVLVEEFIKGRELTMGLFKAGGKLTTLPITEILSSKEFFDYEAKYTPGITNEVTPAQIPDTLTSRIQQTASALYNQLNCRGIVRIDFIYEDATGDLYFLEANTMPGQSENSLVPQQVRAAGMTLKDFYGTLLEECMK